jgi:hypothetical protein
MGYNPQGDFLQTFGCDLFALVNLDRLTELVPYQRLNIFYQIRAGLLVEKPAPPGFQLRKVGIKGLPLGYKLGFYFLSGILYIRSKFFFSAFLNLGIFILNLFFPLFLFPQPDKEGYYRGKYGN